MSKKDKKLTEEQMDLQVIVEAKEPMANIVLAKLLLVVAACYVFAWITSCLGLIEANAALSNIYLLGNAAMLVIISALALSKKGQPKWIKYAIIVGLLLSIFGVNIMAGYALFALYVIPVVVACRYFNYRLVWNAGVGGVAGILIGSILNATYGMAWGLMDLNTVSYPGNVTLQVNQSLFEAVRFSDYNTGLILQNTFIASALPNWLILLVVTLVCIAIITVAQKNMLQAFGLAQQKAEVMRQKAEIEVQMAESKNKIMISQIRPHFLYNTLTAIMAIDGNPDETIDALGEFSKYLRENLDVLDSESMTPMTKEMQHVERYVTLEQLRFGDRVQVTFDTPVMNFSIPQLTVQMLIENAIKHGISKKPEGGHVWVKTLETDTEFQIVVEDDGLGFDVNQAPDESRSHVGLGNIRSRLANFCKGSLEIESTPGEGTKAVVHVPKAS